MKCGTLCESSSRILGAVRSLDPWSPLNPIDVDSTSELAGIFLLLIHSGFQPRLGFSSMKVFARKVVAAEGGGYLGYPS